VWQWPGIKQPTRDVRVNDDVAPSS
jgi:hypothetical protein